MNHINVHVIIFFLFNFPIIVFNINFFIIFTLLQPLSLPYLFISPLPSTLISFIIFPFIFLYFCHNLFSFHFLIIIFNIFLFHIYTSPTFLPPLPFHLPTTSPTFLLLSPSHLPTTLYINIILHLSFHLPLFLSLLIHLSYYKFVTISFILCIVFPYKKKKVLSLSLSLSHTHNFWVNFYFLFFLHLCFRLIIFYIL